MGKKKKNKYILRILLTILIVMIFLCLSKNVHAVELVLETEKVSDKYSQWLELPENERTSTIAPQMYVKNIEDDQNIFERRMKSSFILGVTNKFNLRNSFSSLKIKDQQDTEQCWDFVTTTQLESYMLMKKNKNVEFSPRHIEYSTARTFLDGINLGRLL